MGPRLRCQAIHHRRRPMTRQEVSSDAAPAALGPYSQAIVAGDFVFCSGMAGIDPATGTVPDGIEAQTEQALVNLAAVLDAAGASMNGRRLRALIELMWASRLAPSRRPLALA